MRVLLLLLLASCGRSTAPPPDAAAGLRSLDNAGRAACVADVMADPRRDPEVQVAVGDRAVDVPLVALDGSRTSVSGLLGDKPLLLVTGSWTCPVYQGRKKRMAKLAERFGDQIDTVLVYTTEAHPSPEDPSPYTGTPWPAKFSDRRQTTSTEERLAIARSLKAPSPVTVVVDPMDEGAEDPFWCTYGPCPHCGFLVSPDGRVEVVHEWFDAATMRGSIEALLAQ